MTGRADNRPGNLRTAAARLYEPGTTGMVMTAGFRCDIQVGALFPVATTDHGTLESTGSGSHAEQAMSGFS
jgi:hypothetical protein